jgi:hypothetical protein
LLIKDQFSGRNIDGIGPILHTQTGVFIRVITILLLVLSFTISCRSEELPLPKGKEINEQGVGHT